MTSYNTIYVQALSLALDCENKHELTDLNKSFKAIINQKFAKRLTSTMFNVTLPKLFINHPSSLR